MISFTEDRTESAYSIRMEILLAMLFAVLTAACSKVYIHLWFTPVPITLQVFAVILSGLVLGSRLGAVSQLMYLSLGVMGLPVFAGFTAGPAYILGPTGGYLAGFIPGAFMAGFVSERYAEKSELVNLLSGISGIAAIYLIGTSWLAVWMGASGDSSWLHCMKGAWIAGAAPFIAVDLVKAGAASMLTAGASFGNSMVERFRGV